uniref:Haloalkanoic acid dehalogenase n=1 Tax=Vreelandella halophila TaxID=86177 RepID=A0A0N7H550_9GAMM|nr:haloalkanoic acid dehalogenase [Halomonas utahensis]
MTNPYFPQASQLDVETESTYEDVELTARVPWVAFGCRVLATFPGYAPLWERSAEAAITEYAEQAADELREESVVNVGPLPNADEELWHAFFDDGEVEDVEEVTYAFNYGNPKYDETITALSESTQMRPVGGAEVNSELEASIPDGKPDGMDPTAPLVDATKASTEVQGDEKEVADLHYHHGPASDFQALFNWPDVLQVVTDEVLAPVADTEQYDADSRELVTDAPELVEGLPGSAGVQRSELMSMLTPNEEAGLTGVLFTYQRFIADITISIIHITECLDGAEAASDSQ